MSLSNPTIKPYDLTMRHVALFITLLTIGCASAERKPEPVKSVARTTTFSKTNSVYLTWCSSDKPKDCDTGYQVQEYSVKNEGLTNDTDAVAGIDGGQYLLELPFGKQYLLSNDKENIWVAPGSSIRIDPSLSSRRQTATLVVEWGEVFVETKKSPVSIIIIAGNTKAYLKGNCLVNLKSLMDEDSTVIAVARGKTTVSVGDRLIFELNEQLEASINKQTQKFNVNTCDTFEVAKKWTLGFIRTNTLKDYFDQVARYYHKTIVFKDFDLAKEKWDLSINYLTDTLENNLAIVGDYTGIDLEEKGDTITVTKRRK